MKKKNGKLIAAAALLGLALTACGSKPAETTAASSAAESSAAEESTDAEKAAAAKETEEAADAAASSTEASADDTASAESTSGAEGSAKSDAAVSDTISEEELDGLYEAVAESAQIAVKDKSMDELAKLLAYPCYIGIDGGVTVKDEAEFLALDPEKVFTDAFVKAITEADPSSVTVSEAGFVLGDPSGSPNVTVGLDAEGAIGITGINY